MCISIHGFSQTLGQWTLTSPMNQGRSFSVGFSFNNHIYVVGGEYFLIPLSSVEMATVNQDGTLSNWAFCSSLNQSRWGEIGGAWNGYLYAVGGEDSTHILSTVERATVQSDGTLGAWEIINSSVPQREGAAGCIYNDWIYITGGSTGLFQNTSSVMRSQINSDGSLSTWYTCTTFLNTARYGHNAVTYNGYMYVYGGFDSTNLILRDIERSPIYPDGNLGPWVSISSTIYYQGDASSIIADGYMFVMGGIGYPSSEKYVERTQLLSNGDLGDWEFVSSMTVGRELLAVVTAQNNIYAIGGFTGYTDTNSVEYVPILNTTDIKKTDWEIFE